MRWTGHVACMGKKRNAYKMRPIGRPRRRWEYNIKMDLRAIGSGVMEWIDLAQDKDNWRVLVNTVMDLGFRNMLVNFRIVKQLVACQEGLSSIALVR
jgi:hypothetical protein